MRIIDCRIKNDENLKAMRVGRLGAKSAATLRAPGRFSTTVAWLGCDHVRAFGVFVGNMRGARRAAAPLWGEFDGCCGSEKGRIEKEL